MRTRTKTRSHSGKLQHATRAAAQAALDKLITNRGASRNRLTVYPCKYAPLTHWHVGHK